MGKVADVREHHVTVLLDQLGRILVELDRRGIGINDHKEFTEAFHQEGDTDRALAGDQIRRDDAAQLERDKAAIARQVLWAKLFGEKSAAPLVGSPRLKLRRELESIATAAARKAIAAHLGED